MSACTNPDVLKVIFFIKQLLDIVFFIIPIGLILMLGIDFFKNVSAGKEDDMKKNLNIAIKRIIFCVCIFFVPTIVSLLTKMVSDALEDTSINYAECLVNANSDKINELIDEQAQEALTKAKSDKTMANVLEAEDAINKKSDKSEKETMLKELETIKSEILDESKKTQTEIEEVRPSVDGTTSSTTTTGGSSHLDSGTQGTYFAPVQGVTGTFGSESSTAGCANNASHDLSGVPSRTPIYAGIDGTAEFKQTYSTQVVSGKKVLTSYGNQVRITASDGTTIIYGHLLKFADGIAAPITETCPKKGTSPPCPAATYQSITTISDTKTVKKGDLIGYLGDTGNSTGPHLHVEIHPQGGRNCVADPWSSFGMK